MATWIARVTVETINFRLEDGSVIRDSQAKTACGRGKKSPKRKVKEVGEALPTAAERLWCTTRLAALRDRVLAKTRG